MIEPVPMVEVWRGDFLESVHRGHAVIADASGGIVRSWGESELTLLPRSSMKMIQALPLVASGAELSTERLALACASHAGAPMHVDAVRAWLSDLGREEADLVCGGDYPDDRESAHRLIRAGEAPGRAHDTCSGKHAGLLMLAGHLGGSLDYADVDHPVQQAVREAFEDTTGRESLGHVTDGCSAPNYATTLLGLATAMARFAEAGARSGVRDRAAARLVEAMRRHPDLVAGEGRACTELMRAMDGVAIKTGAEGVYVAILPARRLGLALKIADGATRAAEAAIAGILVMLGALDPAHPAARARTHAPILSRRGEEAGEIRAVVGD